MTNYFDDDSFWDEQPNEATSQITRVNRRTPERTRSHHVVTRDVVKRDDAPRPVQHDDGEGEMWLEPVARRGARRGSLGSIDPRLLSAGAVALAVMLAVPILGALGDDGGDNNDAFRSIAEAQATTSTAAPTTVPVEIVITAAVNEAETVEPVESDSAESDSTDSSDSASSSEGAGASASAGDSAPAALRAPDGCSNTYEVAAGDYWVGIADTAGVSLDDLLAANGASADTALYPGSAMCLPDGAAMPTPATEPPTTPAPTTAAPTTAAPTTVPPTTRPTTTAPRNTTPPPSGGQVEQMIRDVWPDELETEALRIAWRESNYRPDVTSRTGCCVGVFQLHWEAHRGWMDDFGVTSRDQLFDARTNIELAYALYQRNGGWGPWAL